MKVIAHLLPANGTIPNHPRWPLLGTGHKKLSSRGALGVVGAYPEGSNPDTCMPPFARSRSNAGKVAQVALPAADPVYGPVGPLFEHWS